MRLRTYCAKSLLFFWRTNLAVVLGAAVGAAALTGALIVGDSMRASLQEVAVGRLGRVDYALVAPRFFREALGGDLTADAQFATDFQPPCPLILVSGGATHAEKRTRVNQVNVIGMDHRFREMGATGSSLPVFFGVESTKAPTTPEAARSVILNQPLADELGARVGDDVILRTGKPDAIASETLLGRRDDTVSTIRVTVAGIIPADGLGAFSLNPRQSAPKNAYLPLATLQRALQQPNRVNALLVAAHDDRAEPRASARATHLADDLYEALQRHVALADLGLKLRTDQQRGYLSLESESILLPPAVVEATIAAASRLGLESSPVLAHLANTIATQSNSGNVIPYSTVAAIDPNCALGYALASQDEPFRDGEILLNEWAAADLNAKTGDSITMTYYMTGALGRLETRSKTFTLRGVVPLDGPAADPGFIPEYKGITDTQNLADWDPPFPVDLRLIRQKDEDYWDQHRTTPKAFITLADGQRLWADQPDRFGRLTSIRPLPLDIIQNTNITIDHQVPFPERWSPDPVPEEQFRETLSSRQPAAVSFADITERFTAALLRELRPDRMGFQWDPVRKRVAEASQGNTDFGMLFIGFSSFLILSAMMLVALLFRLSIERRAHEIGLLLGTGFSPRTITRLLLTEATALSVIGAAVGLLIAGAYAWLMLAGLRSWWSDAVHAPFLRLHGSTSTYAIGFIVSVVIAAASAAWSIRGLTKRSPRSLLAAATENTLALHADRRRRLAALTAVAAFAAAITFVILPSILEGFPKTVAFFLAGAAMLTACLALLAHRLRANPRGIIHKPGMWAAVRLGLHNAPRNLGRSMLTAGLIASATFVIISLEAFRLDADTEQSDRRSGTGGFVLYAESAAPLPYDLNTAEGREALNLNDPALDSAGGLAFVPFRLRPGDESSCLNLYQATKPRILGVTDAMMERGGFRFAASLAQTQAERENPWLLLNHTFLDGAVPAIGDEAAVKWQLHLDLGKDLILENERGRETRLRFVALLKGSALQSELLVAEAQFVRLFPSITGHAFFLIDAPLDRATDVETILERQLERFSFDAAPTTRRLAEFLAVQNTYISTFQTLGTIGLLLGTAGLATVILRNVWERRGELALLRTLGFSRFAITTLVLSENAALLVSGLLSGCLAALVAIAPAIAADPLAVPWRSLAITLVAVWSAGILACVLPMIPALRSPILKALRAE